MKKKLYIAIAWVVGAAPVFGQDSVSTQLHKLEQVEIVESRATPQNLSPKTIERTQNLGEFLDLRTGSLVKFNGASGVSTLNLNGLGGQHAALLWNGTNLQSSMNGFTDLNLVPMFLFDQVDVSAGFGDQPLGNGLGGSLNLNSKKLRNEVLLSLASFNSQKVGLSLGLLNRKRSRSSLKTYASSAENNFRYRTSQGNDRFLSNAAFKQWHFMPQYSFNLNSKSQIKADLWYLKAKRGIPPTLFQTRSAATQEDENLRATIAYIHHHKNEGKARKLHISLTYLDEDIQYRDSIAGIRGDNQAKSLLASINQGFHSTNPESKTTNSLFIIGSLGMGSTSTLNYEPGKIVQHSGSALVRVQRKSVASRWVYNASVKAEQFIGETPWGFEVNGKYQFSKKWNVSVFGGKTYRFPTFNDLYWTPGGNESLRVEDAWKNHVQVHYRTPKGFSTWLQIHQSFVDNWIQWIPEASGIWGAQNVKEVWARGIDLNLRYSQRISRAHISFTTNYSYTRTENRSSTHFVIPGSQLVYVPYHKGSVDLSYTNKKFQLSLLHQLVGKRFITADNNQSLPTYQLDHLRGLYKFKKLRVGASINNLFNVEYQSTANVPMPFRNVSISIHYNFKKLFK